MSGMERTVEVAAGEFVKIPWSAWKAFRRPAFAYTALCPDERLRPLRRRNRKEGHDNDVE